MIKECIILAGGLGTRLRSEVTDRPKCLANISLDGEYYFLELLIKYLIFYKFEKLIFSLGYMHNHILIFLKEKNFSIQYDFVIESESLDTGGAIKFALTKSNTNHPLILNADTFYDMDIDKLYDKHFQKLPFCTIGLKKMNDFDRYGVVEIDQNSNIISFKEKIFTKSGLINVGIMILNKKEFEKFEHPIKFSFEKDFLSKNVNKVKILGFVSDDYFIDIGIPEDYKRSKNELKVYISKYDN
jgi:D-glycero-alpha-D-manno-heptose 1-phosphate guanylyltransferase